MKFETPYVEVKKFDVQDILTTSASEVTTPSESGTSLCTEDF